MVKSIRDLPIFDFKTSSSRLYSNQVYREEDNRAEVCPYCKGSLEKVSKYWDWERGWVRFKRCRRCMVKLEQTPQHPSNRR